MMSKGSSNMRGQGSKGMMGQGSMMRQPPNMFGMRSPTDQPSLSMLSDAVLLDKAQAKEGARHLPPPCPIMPGNLLRQGLGRLELQREEERGEGNRGEASGG